MRNMRLFILLVVILSNSVLVLALNNSAELINAPKLWDYDYLGNDVKICVIDSGIILNHPDILNIAGQKCFCSDNCCPNGLSEDNLATDTYGHGTHVTGIIGSSDNEFKGISNQASIYAVKVSDSKYRDDIKLMQDIAKAVDWCRDVAQVDI